MFLESAGRPDVIAGTDPADAVRPDPDPRRRPASRCSGCTSTSRAAAGSPRRCDRRRAGPGPRLAALERQRARIDDRFDPAQGARRDCPLPAARRAPLRARRPGGRLLPHGHRQPPAGARRLRRRPPGPLRAAVLRHRARPPRGGLPPAVRASATTPRCTTGACWAPCRSCTCTAPTAPRCARLAALQTRGRLERGRAPPARPHAGVRGPGALYSRRTRSASSCASRQPRDAGTRLRRRRSARSRARSACPAALYRGLRPAALDLLVELAARVRALSGGAAPLTVASAVTDGATQQLVGDAETGAEHRLLVPDRAPYAEPRSGGGVPGDARPASGAQPDRLGAGAARRSTITVASDASDVLVDGP